MCRVPGAQGKRQSYLLQKGLAMPINRKLYPADWKDISRRIRFERAGGRCEWCGAENYTQHPVTGSKVILTTAHLGKPLPDGTPGSKENKMDCRPENLAALCQRCHLNYDRAEILDKQRENRRKQRLQQIIESGQLPLINMENDV